MMEKSENELLKRSVELAEDNNKMLHSMRRTMRISTIFSAVYWILIVGTAIGAYYFIQPYLDNIYNEMKFNFENFNTVLKSLKK